MHSLFMTLCIKMGEVLFLYYDYCLIKQKHGGP